MDFWVRILPKFISSILSVLDSANLRNQLFELKEEHEIMWTALDDIARMHSNSPAGKYAKIALEKIKNTYGR